MPELLMAAIALIYHGHTWTYDRAFVTAMPGTSVSFQASGPSGKYVLRIDRRTSVQTSPRTSRWTAPDRPGTHGLGFYPATTAHPPFVHVDVRATRARWRG